MPSIHSNELKHQISQAFALSAVLFQQEAAVLVVEICTLQRFPAFTQPVFDDDCLSAEPKISG